MLSESILVDYITGIGSLWSSWMFLDHLLFRELASKMKSIEACLIGSSSELIFRKRLEGVGEQLQTLARAQKEDTAALRTHCTDIVSALGAKTEKKFKQVDRHVDSLHASNAELKTRMAAYEAELERLRNQN